MDFLEQQQIIAIKENVSVSDDFTGVKLGQEGWREQENKQNNAKIVGGQIEGTDADTVLTLQVIKSQPNGFVVRSQRSGVWHSQRGKLSKKMKILH